MLILLWFYICTALIKYTFFIQNQILYTVLIVWAQVVQSYSFFLIGYYFALEGLNVESSEATAIKKLLRIIMYTCFFIYGGLCIF